MAITDEDYSETVSLRNDLLVDCDQKYCRAVQDALEQPRTSDNMATPGPEIESRMRVRKSLVESPEHDPNGFERLIGRSDLVSVNFLSRGLNAAGAVCRIRVPAAGGGWFGTGFLAGPGLLVTNNHVLRSAKEANQAEAEFGYEHDEEGVLKEPVQFNLAPDQIFFTDIDHDITLVAVVDHSDGGVPLERFGYLPLLPLSGKGLDNEWVTIAQHPGGQPKQLTIRANRIIEPPAAVSDTIDLDRFIHYHIDTQPGSSGAPVLNDQWQVVAVHHKAIPRPGKETRRRLERGEEPEWLANEGVRISAVTRLLESLRFSDIDAARAVDRLERAIGLRSRPTEASPEPLSANSVNERDPKPHKPDMWKTWSSTNDLGYDPNFLNMKLDLLDILGKEKSNAATLKDKSGVVLDYLHYSAVLHKKRTFPLITAVNINGDKLIHPGDSGSRFRRDTRMDDEFQPAANFYERKLGDDPVQFSRGHMVRRLDPCWGDSREEARLADRHTFHYSNAAPQVQGFNVGNWLDIEDYILNRAQLSERKLTVFTGPIFRGHDPKYGKNRDGGPWRVPVAFWKIAVVNKGRGRIAATAFIQGQTKFVKALFEARVFTNLRQKTLRQIQSENLQTTIKTVEEESHLNFKNLRKFDSVSALESTRQTRFLNSVDDIII